MRIFIVHTIACFRRFALNYKSVRLVEFQHLYGDSICIPRAHWNRLFLGLPLTGLARDQPY